MGKGPRGLIFLGLFDGALRVLDTGDPCLGEPAQPPAAARAET
jgi:hypothetical protein